VKPAEEAHHDQGVGSPPVLRTIVGDKAGRQDRALKGLEKLLSEEVGGIGRGTRLRIGARRVVAVANAPNGARKLRHKEHLGDCCGTEEERARVL
jgi:hypothetical protein